MKSIIENKKNKKMTVYICTLLVVIALAVATYVVAFNGNILGWRLNNNSTSVSEQENKNNTDIPPIDTPATDEQRNTGTTIKQDSLNTSENDTSKKVDVSISSVKNNSSLRISSILQVTTNSGTCTLTLSKDGQTPITMSAGVQALSSYSTCKGFDIPLNSLTSGAWEATVSFENGEHTGESSISVDIN